MKNYYTLEEAAIYLGVNVSELSRFLYWKRGNKYKRLGKRIFYPKALLTRYEKYRDAQTKKNVKKKDKKKTQF